MQEVSCEESTPRMRLRIQQLVGVILHTLLRPYRSLEYLCGDSLLVRMQIGESSHPLVTFYSIKKSSIDCETHTSLPTYPAPLLPTQRFHSSADICSPLGDISIGDACESCAE